MIVLAASPVHAEDSGPGESDALSDRTAGYVEAALAEFWNGQEEDVKAECSLAGEARMKEGGVGLTVTLDCGPGAVFRGTGGATAASAASRARSIARGLLEERALAKGERSLSVRIIKGEIETRAQAYSRRTALALSLVPTTLLIATGVTLHTLAMTLDGTRFNHGMFVSGMTMWHLGIVVGPSIGWMYLGRGLHAFVSGVGRFAMIGATAAFKQDHYKENYCWDEEDSDDPRCNSDSNDSRFWLVFMFISATATLVVTYVDAALVGRAADVENDRRREASNKPQVSFAPVPIVTPSGRTVPGAMLGVSF